jgi:hypothetical protein
MVRYGVTGAAADKAGTSRAGDIALGTGSLTLLFVVLEDTTVEVASLSLAGITYPFIFSFVALAAGGILASALLAA